MTTTVLYGYALKFDASILLAATEEYECFDRCAFDAMLSRRHSIDIRWDSHDSDAPRMADSCDGTAGILADNYGLGFWAKVETRPNWSRLRAITTRTNPTDRCSVGGLRIDESRFDRHLGARRTTILSAHIDHISIVADAAHGNHTGVWLADRDLDAAPYRIQMMAATWGEGRRIPRPALNAAKSSSRRDLPPGLASLMTARSAHYRELRERFVTASAKGQASGQVFAHVALTKAGGFDGNFAALARAARTRRG